MIPESPTRRLPIAPVLACALLGGALSLPMAAYPVPAVAQETDTADWDVTAAHGPTRDVSFTTTEGTWMTVDVSPDGRTLIFDLLGDLYTLPVEGGRATRITSGPAWDVQPRFSPDGSRIAFTSDRDGADNLWVARADGSDPRQVSTEDFRLLNGPAWTPDGEWLLGRKHFTSTRSLGAGEVWMYHVSGTGSGLQVTERSNDQQDQGNEIAVSPDGRWIYFSEDATGGTTFEYNKDPNPGIYAVRRLDRETGEVETLISGPGGAARPVPSPDGRKVAFVRRVRGESVLYVYDLETGAERPVWDGLDHDQMEAWAIFGVYPNFAWLPGSREVVMWAQGGLWRVDTESRSAEPIPFEAEVEQTLTEALRVPVEVSPQRFPARMITDAATTPDGRTLVFHAVGHLWSKRLPDGPPRRLTDDDRFEYAPSVSPDGRTVVYTTWDDEEYGAIHSVPLSGGEPRRLTSRPGHYFEPRFSPDGRSIVYRRGGGNALLGELHATERGIWIMDADGSDPRRIRDEGSDARFDHTGERIYVLTGGGLEKEYRSVDLHGGDERVHFSMRYPVEVVPSPDGRWVAWTELFRVYVAPFPRTGETVELSRNMGVPVRTVTRDAGIGVHWSVDSRTLRWTLGPEYFSRDLDRTFAFVPGAPDSIPPPDTAGTDIGLTVETDVPTGRIALTNARIVTMRGQEVIEDGTLVVSGNRIERVGPASEVAVPSDARVVDLGGRTVLPGIVDAHAHASHFSSGPGPRQNWVYFANLAYGVTTMHDPSANTEFVFRQAELQRAGEIVAPRIFSTGRILYGAEGDFRAIVDSLGDALSHVRRMAAVGAISVKSYNQPRRDQRQQLLAAARDLGIMVVPEGGSTFFHNVNMIVDGHTGIEHNIPVAPLYRDVLELWRHSETGYTPTLVVNYGGPSGERWWYQETDVWETDRLLSFFPRGMLDAMSRRVVRAPEEEYHHVTVARQAKRLVDQGNLVQVGAHGQLQGLAAHWELWMLHQGGMTPWEALRSATLHGARYLGMDGDLGSLEEGKLADLFVVDGDPLTDLRTTEAVTHVMVNGRLFDAATMDEIGGRGFERSPFWWQRGAVDDSFIWREPGGGGGR